jgi:xylose dehydrogenase (NAD/NADP)
MSNTESSRGWRVGLVGSGGIAHAHANACEQLDNVDLAAICDVSEEALQQFGRRDGDHFTVGERYLDLDKMLDEAALDIAVITNWGSQHAKTGIALAKSGQVKGILCEKPLTMNAAEAEAMVAVSQESGVLLAEAFKFRHHPMHIRAQQMIDAGAIGEVMTLRSTFCTGGGGTGPEARPPESNWRFNKAKGGGSIFDLACYNIHHARFVFGAEPVRVFAAPQAGVEVDDAAFILLVFPDEKTAQISVGFNCAGGQYAEISGRGGMLRLDSVWNNENRPVNIVHTSPKGVETIDFPSTFQFALQLEHMVDCLANGTPHRIPPENSIAQMRLIDAIYESMGSGKAVEL